MPKNDLTKYLSIRDQMKTGDLLEFRGHSLISRLIEGRTGEFSHSSLVLRMKEYEGQERRRFTMSAESGGVMLFPLSRYLEEYDGEVTWFPLKDEWDTKRTTIGENALFFSGVKYDFPSLCKQLIVKVSASARKLFCSELCFICWGFTGIAPNPSGLSKLDVYQKNMIQRII